jgi:hypothetical protein
MPLHTVGFVDFAFAKLTLDCHVKVKVGGNYGKREETPDGL